MFNIMFVPIVIAAYVLVSIALWRQCRNAGHITTDAWLFIGTTSIFWLEAPWDWTLFVRFNLEVYPLIIPKHWPIFGMADGLGAEAPFVYGLWFFLPAWLAKTYLGPRGWSTTAIVLTTVAFGAVFEAVAEILIFIIPERYAYTQVLPGLAWAEGTPHQYPLDVPIWVGAYVGACCLVLLRSYRVETGQVRLSDKPTLTAGLLRLRAFGGTDDRFSVNLLSTLILYSLFYFLSMVPALVIRFAHLRTVVGDPTPFGHMPWPGM